MSSKFSHIQLLTAELAALDQLKKSSLRTTGIQNILTTCWLSGERRCPLGFLLAHLSRRLIGELIVYQWSGVRRRRCPQCSNIFFSETALPIKAKFYVDPPWVGGTIFCSRHLGHMTKMAATPIYGRNPSKIFFSRTGGPISTKLGM